LAHISPRKPAIGGCEGSETDFFTGNSAVCLNLCLFTQYLQYYGSFVTQRPLPTSLPPQFTFPMDYPSKPPSVYFLQPPPRHEHVYTNGDICLNLLGRDWRPNMTASMLALSILSMLSSAREKKIPQDNHVHADNPPGKEQANWLYHDDRC